MPGRSDRGPRHARAHDQSSLPNCRGPSRFGRWPPHLPAQGLEPSDSRALTGISGDAGNNSQAFAYDELNCLTSSSLSAASRTYQYDLDGNRTQKVESGTTIDYSFDRTDQLIKQTIASVDKVTSFDAFGNLTQAADNANAYTTYAFDEANRLTSITPPAGSAATFTIDALDRHATRTVGPVTDTYGYVGPTETAFETSSTGTRSLLDLDGSRLAVKNGSTVAWVVFDLHGSVAALCTAGTTTLTDAYRYDGFGQTIATSGTSANPWKYRGLLTISPGTSDALYDMVARDYSPSRGTFTQLDTVAGSAANPLTMNRYLYALANPATLIDPDGHAPRKAPGGTRGGGDGGDVGNGTDDGGGAAPPGVGSPDPPPGCDRGCESPWLDPHRFDGMCLLANPNVNSGWYQPACLSTYYYVDPADIDPNARAFGEAFVIGAGLAALAALCIAATIGGCTPLVVGAGVATGWAGTRRVVDTHGFDVLDIHVGGTEPWAESEIYSLAGGALGGCVVGCLMTRVPMYDYTGILADHVAAGTAQFNTVGFTRGQDAAIGKYPQYNLEPMFRGERIDTFAKASAGLDPRLSNMTITGRFQSGPDFVMGNRWWDVTTRNQWQTHVDDYGPTYGYNAFPLYYQPAY